MIAAIAFAAVVNTGEVAVRVVLVATLEQVFVPRADAVCLKSALFVVLVLAEQQALLALLFATSAELVASQPRAVEVDAAQPSTGQMTVIERAAIGQTAVAELTDVVVFVAQGAPDLVFLDELVCKSYL